jgi:glycosyltransferase involved in cell wall biosynthesis
VASASIVETNAVLICTSNISSLPEVAGDAGLLVNPLDLAELTQAMRQVLSDSEIRQRMRAGGLGQARQFTWEKTACRTLQVYEEAYALVQGGVSW